MQAAVQGAAPCGSRPCAHWAASTSSRSRGAAKHARIAARAAGRQQPPPLVLRSRGVVSVPGGGLFTPAVRGVERGQRTVLASAAADAAGILGGNDGGNGAQSPIWKRGTDKAVVSPEDWTRPLALPQAPKEATLVQVMPYIFKIATGEAGLKLRVAACLFWLMASKAAGLAGPVFFKNAIDSYSSSVQVAVKWVVLMGAAKMINGVGNELRNLLFAPIPQAAGRRVALHTLSHVLGMDVRFHLERRTGALSRIIDRGTRSVAMLFRAVVFTFLPTIVELVLVCGLLAKSFEPHVAALVVVTFSTYSYYTGLLTARIAENRKEVNRLDQLATGKAVDALLNYETVVLFNNENLEASLYDQMLIDYQKAQLSIETLSCKLNGGQSVILTCGVTLVLTMVMLGGYTGSGAPISVGDIVMVNGLLLQLAAPLQFLGFFYRELRKSLVDMESMFKILNTESALDDGSVDLVAAARDMSAVRSKGVSIEVEDVEFGYLDERQILKGVSVKVEPGQSVALVGASGSGKSTLLRLILRMYDVDSGRVKVDGEDVRDVSLESLRRSTAVVPQDTVLFNDSILANIAYGRPTATVAEAIEAAKAARLHRTIGHMPKGYDTVVGERGLKLSGGEKQRVAIARAFLKAPRLLVCDEATSALDSSTEAGILTSLKELAKGRTCVFVAHRLSTVRHCDNIVVMEQGRVVEQGTHDDLIALRGHGERVGAYAEMWELQQSEQGDSEARRRRAAAGEDGEDELGEEEEEEMELGQDDPHLEEEEEEEGLARGPIPVSDAK